MVHRTPCTHSWNFTLWLHLLMGWEKGVRPTAGYPGCGQIMMGVTIVFKHAGVYVLTLCLIGT